MLCKSTNSPSFLNDSKLQRVAVAAEALEKRKEKEKGRTVGEDQHLVVQAKVPARAHDRGRIRRTMEALLREAVRKGEIAQGRFPLRDETTPAIPENPREREKERQRGNQRKRLVAGRTMLEPSSFRIDFLWDVCEVVF